jgi:hypothetical protein
MANGQLKSLQNAESFLTWMASTTDDDYKQIVFRGKLNRIQVAKGCGFSKSVLQQNPKVKEMLFNLETSLRKRNVLPQLSDKGESKLIEPRAYDKNQNKRTRDSRRVSELEQKVVELEAKLRRYQELAEVITEMGVDI